MVQSNETAGFSTGRREVGSYRNEKKWTESMDKDKAPKGERYSISEYRDLKGLVGVSVHASVLACPWDPDTIHPQL